MAINGVVGLDSSAAQTQNTSAESTRNTGEMGKDQFLKLLVTQLKYQDPLKPMEDKEFISQMAQFSSLEQMQNLNTNFSAMKAFTLMGKNISADVKDSETGEQTYVNGIVEKVLIDKGKVSVRVGERDIPIDEIIDISDTNNAKITELMSFIGKKVSGKLVEKDGGMISVTGNVKSVEKQNGVDFAVLDLVDLSNVDVVLPEGAIEYSKDYLASNVDKEVEVKVKDEFGRSVHVVGILKEFTENEGKFNVKLSEVGVPIANVTAITQNQNSGVADGDQ